LVFGKCLAAGRQEARNAGHRVLQQIPLTQDLYCNKVIAAGVEVEVVNHKNRNWKQNAFAG